MPMLSVEGASKLAQRKMSARSCNFSCFWSLPGWPGILRLHVSPLKDIVSGKFNKNGRVDLSNFRLCWIKWSTIWWIFKSLKNYYSIRNTSWSPLKYSPRFEHIYPQKSCHCREQLWRASSVSLNAAAACRPAGSWLLLKIKITLEGKHSESVQDPAAAMSAQLIANWRHSWKKTCRIPSESSKSHGLCSDRGGDYSEGELMAEYLLLCFYTFTYFLVTPHILIKFWNSQSEQQVQFPNSTFWF